MDARESAAVASTISESLSPSATPRAESGDLHMYLKKQHKVEAFIRVRSIKVSIILINTFGLNQPHMSLIIMRICYRVVVVSRSIMCSVTNEKGVDYNDV